MNREERLNKAYEIAIEISKNYSFKKYQELMDICGEDIFYSEGNDNDFYIEDDHFIYENK